MGIAYTSKCLDYTIYGKSEQKTSTASVNVFNSIFETGSISSTGTNIDDSAMIRSKDYTLVAPSTQYIASNNGAGIAINIYEYDKDKKFINYVPNPGAGTSFTTSTNAKYVRFARGFISNLLFQLQKGSTITSYVPFSPDMPSPDYPSEIKCVNGVRNLFDGIMEVGGILSNTGNNGPNELRLRTTNYIDIYDNKIVTISCEGDYQIYTFCYDNDKMFLGIGSGDWKNMPLVLTPLLNTKYIRFMIRKSDNRSLTLNDIPNIIVEEDSTAHPYVPYGTWLRVDDVGKNRIKLNKSSTTINGISIKTNDDGSITFNGTCTTNNTEFRNAIALPNGNTISQNNTLSVYYVSGSCTKSESSANSPQINLYDSSFSNSLIVNQLYNLNSNNKALYSTRTSTTSFSSTINRFRFDEGVVCNNFTIKVMLTDDMDTKYFPYFEPKTHFLPLEKDGTTYELCSIGDVRDEYVVENGYAKIEKKIEKTILNGNETYTLNDIYNNIAQFTVNTAPKALYINDSTITAISNRFKGVGFRGNKGGDSWTINNSVVIVGTENVKFMINSITTVENFKKWIKEQYDNGMPIMVYYMLKEPYTVNLGQVDFPIVNGEIKGIAYNGKEVKGIAYNGEVIYKSKN